jgi:hypothetical protein
MRSAILLLMIWTAIPALFVVAKDVADESVESKI